MSVVIILCEQKYLTTYVVDKHIDNRYADDYLTGSGCAWVLLINDSDDKLAEAAYNQAPGEKDTAAAIIDHDRQIDQDSEDANSH